MGTGTGTGARQRQTDVSDTDGHTDGQRRTDVSDRDGQRRLDVSNRDGQRQTDVSDRDRQRQTDVSKRDGRHWTSVAETEELEETEETEETESRLIFRIEYKRLYEEKKKTEHGRQPSLYTQFSQLTYVLILTQLTYVLIPTTQLTYVLIQPSLTQPGPKPTLFPRSRHPERGADTLSKIETSGARCRVSH